MCHTQQMIESNNSKNEEIFHRFFLKKKKKWMTCLVKNISDFFLSIKDYYLFSLQFSKISVSIVLCQYYRPVLYKDRLVPSEHSLRTQRESDPYINPAIFWPVSLMISIVSVQYRTPYRTRFGKTFRRKLEQSCTKDYFNCTGTYVCR